MNISTILKKEHPGLPDFYTVTVKYLTGEELTIKIANHKIIDKVYETKISKNRKKTVKCVGVLTCPYFEYWTVDNTLGSFPLSSVAHMEFDGNFTKTIDINKSISEKNIRKED